MYNYIDSDVSRYMTIPVKICVRLYLYNTYIPLYILGCAYQLMLEVVKRTSNEVSLLSTSEGYLSNEPDLTSTIDFI